MKNLIRKLKFNLKHLFNTKKLTRDDILNKWLLYHNTSVKDLINKHPKEVLQNPEWFSLYPITEKQYDKWEVWCKKKLRKYYTEREIRKSCISTIKFISFFNAFFVQCFTVNL